MKAEEAVVEDISQLVSQSGNPTETLTSIVNLIQERFTTDVCLGGRARTGPREPRLAPPLVCVRERGSGADAITEGLAHLVAEQAKTCCAVPTRSLTLASSIP